MVSTGLNKDWSQHQSSKILEKRPLNTRCVKYGWGNSVFVVMVLKWNGQCMYYLYVIQYITLDTLFLSICLFCFNPTFNFCWNSNFVPWWEVYLFFLSQFILSLIHNTYIYLLSVSHKNWIVILSVNNII